jgi:hypothetical protein
MAMEVSNLFDESNAYSVSFKLRNTGVIPLTNLSVAVGFCSIQTKRKDFYITPNNCATPSGLPVLRIGAPEWGGHRLTHEETFTVSLADEMSIRTHKYTVENPRVIAGLKTLSDLVSANVVVVVTYDPWFIPYTQQKPFRFVVQTQPNDKVMWKSVPFDR